VTSYEEWRVAGHISEGFGLYEFTWSPSRGDRDPEAKARGFMRATAIDTWLSGPHLHKRTVTVTDWEEA